MSKLFGFVEPDRAYFGEKDFQQIAVIRKMVQLEGFKLQIVACPIKREDDGLALSSRNVRLTAEQRQLAPNIYRVLKESCNFANRTQSQRLKSLLSTALTRCLRWRWSIIRLSML